MRKYKMTKPKGNKGVFAISLVQNPAMESEWVALKEQPLLLKGINDKEQMLLGVALIPDKPIYRNDENGEYLIEFSKDVIKETAHKFITTGQQNNATLDHEITLGKEVVNVVESWLIEDDEKDKTRLYGINEPVGSWVIKMKVNDPELYQLASKGILKGISIEGLFDKELVNLKKENMSKSIAEEIKEGFSEAFKLFKTEKPVKVKLGSVTLVDGETVVEYEGEELVAGINATVNGEPAPVGTHTTENGMVIVIEEAGVIARVEEAEAEAEVEAEKDQVKKAIVEAVMNLGKELKNDFDTKLSEQKKVYESKITELESQVTKLSKTENKSVKTQTQQPVSNVPLDSTGRLLQTLRSL